MKIRFTALLFTSCLAVSPSVRAATFLADPADNSLNGSGMDSVTNFDLTPGGVGAYNRAVIPFQLPNLGAGTFSNVSFSFYLESVSQGSFNFPLNVRGLTRTDVAPTVLSTDSGAASTLLETNLVDAFAPTGWAITSDTTTISGWLNSQYANGANAGKYVFIVLQANTNAGSPTYSFYSASAPGTGMDPIGTYTFTTVPEPSTCGLIGAGVLFSASAFRRRKTNAKQNENIGN